MRRTLIETEEALQQPPELPADVWHLIWHEVGRTDFVSFCRLSRVSRAILCATETQFVALLSDIATQYKDLWGAWLWYDPIDGEDRIYELHCDDDFNWYTMTARLTRALYMVHQLPGSLLDKYKDIAAHVCSVLSRDYVDATTPRAVDWRWHTENALLLVLKFFRLFYKPYGTSNKKLVCCLSRNSAKQPTSEVYYWDAQEQRTKSLSVCPFVYQMKEIVVVTRAVDMMSAYLLACDERDSDILREMGLGYCQRALTKYLSYDNTECYDPGSPNDLSIRKMWVETNAWYGTGVSHPVYGAIPLYQVVLHGAPTLPRDSQLHFYSTQCQAFRESLFFYTGASNNASLAYKFARLYPENPDYVPTPPAPRKHKTLITDYFSK